jgi:predicted ATPase
MKNNRRTGLELFSTLQVISFQHSCFSNLSTLEFHPDVTLIVGENGSGKFTLIEAIALNLDLALKW